MEQTQLLKGILEGCVLEIISQKEIYGYELIQELKKLGFNIVAGTIYPLLQKLEKKGYIKSWLKASPDGPDRKYFTITVDGELYLQTFWQQWEVLAANVEKVKTWRNLK
ncbi:lineage-specific thermal regulator protein [Streptococcus constellatus]|uniref:Lineage-specific thermal regulator protein n=1 Tax=Streptococcus constellatus TaxID=76860 RepID=A0A564TNJ4_STRCV|nr:PadR family transcriptional regulator [Streptococcus constellatus]VUX02540.1 lineage-specific thermal regulator protein [Streptococcus gordonii]VUX08863.1 lineage-specific thermal regulator protein [Streptococcus constellatus]